MEAPEILYFLLLAFVNSFVIIGLNKAAHYDSEIILKFKLSGNYDKEKDEMFIYCDEELKYQFLLKDRKASYKIPKDCGLETKFNDDFNGQISEIQINEVIVEDSKMILWKFRYWCLKNLGVFWSKPIITCCTCMSSVHSSYIYWPAIIFSPFTISILAAVLIYPLFILMLAGMVTLINNYT